LALIYARQQNVASGRALLDVVGQRFPTTQLYRFFWILLLVTAGTIVM